MTDQGTVKNVPARALSITTMTALIPAIVQDARTRKVLMLGYMNEEALAKTRETGLVTFWSRSRQCLWTKGETSGNYLDLVSIANDCDQDTLLIQANPRGPVCHTGTDTCWGDVNAPDDLLFLRELQDFIDRRRAEMPEGSYTTELFKKGTRKIAKKLGEEAVECVIGATANDDENFLYESADVLYHLIVLLTHKGYRIEDVCRELKSRHH